MTEECLTAEGLRTELRKAKHYIGELEAIITQQQAAERCLREEYSNRLEELVSERTLELNKITEQLKREVDERRRSEEKLRFMATHDPLTDIPNRYHFAEKLREASLAAGLQNKSALILIDLDNFKVINDTFGHKAGDQLLVDMARLLKKNIRSNDVLARLGGDEFGILLDDTDAVKAARAAEQFRRLLDEGELCVDTQQVCFNLTISIGVVIIDGTLDEQELLSSADTALYAAKEEGKNRISIIESAQDKAKLSETNIMVNKIKTALRENQFELHFQPVCDAAGEIVHYEALIRLRNEDGSVLYPNSFIPVAERFGLMAQIDRWVVTTAVKILNDYPGQQRLFVNLSGISLGDKALLAFIETKIRKSGIEPERIGFEITETTAVKDLTQAENWIKRLKALGCCFALDDFGVGFSSFSYLSALPVDYLKIDGSFVREIDSNQRQLALVKAMNSVAHTLGKKTIAEFVENQSIARLLGDIGVDCGQGYYYGKPSPLTSMGW